MQLSYQLCQRFWQYLLNSVIALAQRFWQYLHWENLSFRFFHTPAALPVDFKWLKWWPSLRSKNGQGYYTVPTHRSMDQTGHQETYSYSSKPLVSSSIEIKINNRFSVGWKTGWNLCWVHHDWKCSIYFRSCTFWSSSTHLFLGIFGSRAVQ